MPSPLAPSKLMLALGVFSLAALTSPATAAAQQSALNPTPANSLYADSSTYPSATATPTHTVATPVAATPSAKLGKPAKAAKVKKAKEKKLKAARVTIERGTLTVDGLTSKAALNYKIDKLQYLYMYVPGTGTIVVARAKFPGATEQKRAFHDDGLTVTADGHVAEVYSRGVLVSRKPQSAWVRLDAASVLNSRSPVLGFGQTADAPYAWPGALAVAHEAGVAADAPPLPRSMLQTSSPQLLQVNLSTTKPAATSTTASAVAPTY